MGTYANAFDKHWILFPFI